MKRARPVSKGQAFLHQLQYVLLPRKQKPDCFYHVLFNCLTIINSLLIYCGLLCPIPCPTSGWAILRSKVVDGRCRVQFLVALDYQPFGVFLVFLRNSPKYGLVSLRKTSKEGIPHIVLGPSCRQSNSYSNTKHQLSYSVYRAIVLLWMSWSIMFNY